MLVRLPRRFRFSSPERDDDDDRGDEHDEPTAATHGAPPAGPQLGCLQKLLI